MTIFFLFFFNAKVLAIFGHLNGNFPEGHIQSRAVSVGSEVGQIDNKWDNSGTCYDKFSVRFHSASQNYH